MLYYLYPFCFRVWLVIVYKQLRLLKSLTLTLWLLLIKITTNVCYSTLLLFIFYWAFVAVVVVILFFCCFFAFVFAGRNHMCMSLDERKIQNISVDTFNSNVSHKTFRLEEKVCLCAYILNACQFWFACSSLRFFFK